MSRWKCYDLIGQYADLGGLAGARPRVGDGGAEQIAQGALRGLRLLGDDADGRVCGEAGVVPAVHGVDDGGDHAQRACWTALALRAALRPYARGRLSPAVGRRGCGTPRLGGSG
jgi:hypothetical protein